MFKGTIFGIDGKVVPGSPRMGLHVWVRGDRFIPDNPEMLPDAQFVSGVVEVHAQDASDLSHWQPGASAGGYDGRRCSCCYLGIPHTVNRHAQDVAEWEAEQARKVGRP